jgi:hypothetical protein
MQDDLLRRYLERGGTIKRIAANGTARAITLKEGREIDLGPVDLAPPNPADLDYLSQWGKPL